MRSVRIYLAGPLFGVAEREFNARLVTAMAALAPELEFVVPQVKAAELLHRPDFPTAMFRFCLESLDSVAAVLALLDGPDADSGTCIECGYAFARGVPIVGVRTDVRGSEVQGVNLMVAGVTCALVHETRTDLRTEQLAAAAIAALRAAVADSRDRTGAAVPMPTDRPTGATRAAGA